METSISQKLLECLIHRPAQLDRLGELFLEADEAEVVATVNGICRQIGMSQLSADAPWWPGFFGLLHRWLNRRAGRLPLDSSLRESMVALYSRLGERCRDRYQLLVLLAISGRVDDLQPLTVLLREDAPQDHDAAAAPFVPLLHGQSQAACMFPVMKVCLDSPSLAAPVLDLANYLTREGIVAEHPLKSDAPRLISLLRGLTQRLEALAQSSEQTADQRSAVGLGMMTVVALADTLALIGASDAIVPLSHALQLPHRRIRVEMAAALARLGDEAGTQALLDCVAEPVSRLRAIRYARELGLDDEIDEAFQSDVAMAEAELASYLSQPEVMGVPPAECRLLDRRRLYWPGYEEPRDCFLFQFTYRAVRGSETLRYTNVGIAGPLAHAFAADLRNFDLEDVYAAFAGWHAEHPEIQHQAYESLPPDRQPFGLLRDRAKQMLDGNIRPSIAGFFFDDPVLAGDAELPTGEAGVFVVDAFDWLWFPVANLIRPLTPEDAYCIYKGRRLLRQFN